MGLLDTLSSAVTSLNSQLPATPKLQSVLPTNWATTAPSIASSAPTAPKVAASTAPFYPTPNGQPIPAAPTVKAPAVPSSVSSSYSGPSIVDYLTSTGKASDYSSRASLASQYGITGYTGTADQNNLLLSKLRGGTATSTAPASPILTSPVVTSPTSGATFDSNTGAMISSGGGSTPTNTGLPQTFAGTTPTTPSTVTEQSDPYQAALQAVQTASQMTPQEIQAQQQLNTLTNSFNTAYTNAQGQAIPLPFITGQQANLQKSATNLAQPLEQQLALSQAQRQLALTGAQAQVEANKPVTLGYGTNLVSPTTGTTVASGGSLADQNAISTFFNLQQSYPDASIAWDPSKSAQENLQAAQASSENSPTYQAKATTIRSVQLPGGGLGFYNSKDGNIYDSNGTVIGNIGSGGNPTVAVSSASGATAAADAASLKTQQGYVDTTQRAFNTANANLTQLVQYMNTAGVNTSSSVPLINTLENKVKAGLLDPGTIAAYEAAISGLRAEYAQVLSRGGEVTDGQRNSASTLIPDNLTPAQLQQVADRLNVEGTNAVKEAQAQVTAIQTRMNTNSTSNFGTSSGASSSSSLYDF